jgi:hypothetical protein
MEAQRVTPGGLPAWIWIRPDYCSPSGECIVDAKYKAILDEPEIDGSRAGQDEEIHIKDFGGKVSNSDMYQILAYSMIMCRDRPGSRKAFLAIPSVKSGHSVQIWRAALSEAMVPDQVSTTRFALPGDADLIAGVLQCKLPQVSAR